jgi:hypothetical protein
MVNNNMKIINFLTTLPLMTGQFAISYIRALKEIWTDKSVYWSLDQTFFHGDKPEELKSRRDKFMQDYKNLIK